MYSSQVLLTILGLAVASTSAVFADDTLQVDDCASCPAVPYGVGTCNDSCCDTTYQPSDPWSENCCGESSSWLESVVGCEESPITLGASITQYYQGVIHGGVREKWRYAGHSEYSLGIDFGKMNVREGLRMDIRAEHRWGQFINQDAGVLLPPALHAVTPVPDSNDVFITNLIITQRVNEHLTVFAGKMDTLDGDRNPFASGRGRTSFMNTSLLLPVNGVPIIPFATLGAGGVLFVEGNPAAQLLVLNATDTTTTSGFNELFRDGAVVLGGVNVPLPLFGKQGIHSFNGGWSSKEFTSLDQNDPRLLLTGRVPINRTTGGWVVWWSGTQFIQQFDPENDPMKGWGLFGRFGVSKDTVAPITYWANAGIGGNSPIRCRQDDRFGIGWFYGSFSSQLGPVATAALNLGDYTTGLELFYNIAVNENFFITPDLQFIEPGSNTSNSALVGGVRAEIAF